MFVGRALRDPEREPFVVVLTNEMEDELRACNPDFWVPLISIIEQAIADNEI
jgi:hypothetical protein